jgi:hypothetical protein
LHRILLSILALVVAPALGQQVADPDFAPAVNEPMHQPGSGPLVLIDEGHNNFHTKDGRYRPFASLVEADGYRVSAHQGFFSAESLGEAEVVVISNSLSAANTEDWVLPTPSAFTDAEIEGVASFVDSGGGLFLIADHMPFPGAAAALAAAFGIEFSNGFVLEVYEGNLQTGPSIFRRSEGRIGEHVITDGRNDSETIYQIATFTGSAFPITGGAVSLIHFGEHTVMLMPTVAWEFSETTARARIPGWSQGVAIEHGDGRVVIFGEAAMFSSQRSGDNLPMGMTTPIAADNQQLLLNIIRWLSFDL